MHVSVLSAGPESPFTRPLPPVDPASLAGAISAESDSWLDEQLMNESALRS